LAWLGLALIHSTLTNRSEHIKKEQPHQEGRDYARLSSHEASLAGYDTAPQQSMLSSSIHHRI
jgi:hypothetical protein